MVDLDTTAIHGGTRPDPVTGAVGDAVVLSSTFDYPELPDGTKSPYIYTRYANPTIEACERRLAALHDAHSARLFSSGMAAIASALRACVKQGERILSSPEIYGGTQVLFDEELPEIGIQVDYLERSDLDAMQDEPTRLADHVQPEHKVLYIESPTNPLLRLLDVPKLTTAAHANGLRVVLDHTFAGPVLSRPLAAKVDLVAESATKSLGGHSDLIAGVVVGNDPELMQRVDRLRRHWGPVVDPLLAARLQRSLATLPLRVRQAGASALTLAHALAERPWVEAVHHPSLPAHPDHRLAGGLDAPVGLVSFVVKGGDDAAVQLRRNLRTVRPAASLGGVETLMCLPFETSHADLSEAARRAVGIVPGTVRLSVGLEAPDDLLGDLDQAARTVGLTANEPL